MKCPRCDTLLSEIAKTGVLVDVCEQCRGIWLDRGELEKITQRLRDLEREWSEDRDRGERRDWRPEAGYGYAPRKKRWTEMFDIFD